MKKGIPFHLLVALLAATAKVRAARAEGQEKDCDCPGCNFRKASDNLLAARKAYAEATAKASKLASESRAAKLEQEDAEEAVDIAQRELNAAADALNAEEAKAEGGAK